ncbi:cytochrome b/b6 domain-containing protein [Elioraea sp.]|jgi:cytochrome b|uniref:cytochrome b/b6 domain-containing protein n=1 Tax=Elioraea sp. TaxID=2185103 RepID=UPI0021DEB3DC|nr:cytochrome b/b6 domain-containing protein [Elioraea sp.]GIX09984.1 MAG: cytochrome b561 [Elioraea sp.]
MRGEGDSTVEARIWDVPTRLFHWALALTLVGSFVTVRMHEMRLHAYCGYMALTLVLFRLLWGVIGSESARFATFLRGPRAALAHLRHLLAGRPDRETSHNALGGWAVVLMLGLVLAQGTTGLFANDDILFDGPLVPLVGKEVSDRLTAWHYRISDLLLIVVIAHVAAVIAYRLAGHRLIEAMVTGAKRLPAGVRPPRLAGPVPAAAALAVAAGTVWAVVNLLG